MTAWTQLIANSSLSSGTAWQHLNAQQGGGTVNQVVVISDGITVTLEDSAILAELQEMEHIAVIEETAFEAVLDDSPIVVEINDDEIVAEIE